MLKIAICEDNEIFVEIIKNNLETMLNIPYKLDSFLSGREFLKALSENVCQYNLVFLDIELEDKSISGIDLGQMINSRNPSDTADLHQPVSGVCFRCLFNEAYLLH